MLLVLMVSILEHISQLYTMVSGAPLNDTFQPYMLSILKNHYVYTYNIFKILYVYTYNIGNII